MNIAKITQETINLAQNTISRCANKSIGTQKPVECSEKLMGALDCLAVSAVSAIKSDKKLNIPEFIYHITSKENYERILQDKKITASVFESGQNGCHGVYLVDKDNFLQKWLGRKEPDLLGDIDIGELLMMWTCKASEPVAVKIPTSRLDLSKLRFRPYIEACVETFEKFDSSTMKVGSKLVKEGLPLSDLSKYIRTNEPIEFVYMDEIPTDIIGGSSTAKFTENMRDMISELFC